MRWGADQRQQLEHLCRYITRPAIAKERLAALVPRPRLHLIRFHGVLAPNAKLFSKIVPTAAERATETSSEDTHAQGAPARMSWTRLLKRVFDIEHCPNCGGASSRSIPNDPRS